MSDDHGCENCDNLYEEIADLEAKLNDEKGRMRTALKLANYVLDARLPEWHQDVVDLAKQVKGLVVEKHALKSDGG